MKLWEVLKELEENPNKVFEFNDVWKTAKLFIDDGWFQLEFYNNVGKLIPEDCDGGAFSGNIHIDSNWQEVKQPVTWQEAIEAWVNGKAIKCVIDGRPTIYKSKSGLQDSMGWAVSPVHIATGTWYIED